MTYRLISLFLSVLLCSCAGRPIYQEPDGTHAAKVRIKNVNMENYYMSINAADPYMCSVTATVGWLNGGRELDSRRVGMLDAEGIKEGILERRVAAGKPISFVPHVVARLDAVTILTGLGASLETVRSAQSGACETPAFIPKANEEYEVLYKPAPGTCSVTLVRLSSAPNGKVLREDFTETAIGSVTPVLGSYLRGIPDVTCKKF